MTNHRKYNSLYQWTSLTPHSGLNHVVSPEGLFAESKEKLIATKLQALLLREGGADCDVQWLVHYYNLCHKLWAYSPRHSLKTWGYFCQCTCTQVKLKHQRCFFIPSGDQWQCKDYVKLGIWYCYRHILPSSWTASNIHIIMVLIVARWTKAPNLVCKRDCLCEFLLHPFVMQLIFKPAKLIWFSHFFLNKLSLWIAYMKIYTCELSVISHNSFVKIL